MLNCVNFGWKSFSLH